MNFETGRLTLRRWIASDRGAFADLNADPQVMAHFPEVLSREESDAMADRIDAHFEEHGFGPWAIEVRGAEPFIGFVGLAVPRFEAPFTPCVEIAWRLARPSWGQGYAPEAAREVLRIAFEDLQLDEVVALTVPDNLKSRRVMEKIGMTRNPSDDFDHPTMAPEHPLRRHVLYRLSRSRWLPGA